MQDVGKLVGDRIEALPELAAVGVVVSEEMIRNHWHRPGPLIFTALAEFGQDDRFAAAANPDDRKHAGFMPFMPVLDAGCTALAVITPRKARKRRATIYKLDETAV